MLWGSWQTVKDPVIPGTCLWCWRASELSPPGSWTQTHSTINCWLPAARTPTSFWLCYKAPTRLLYCAVLNMSQQTHLANTKDSFCQLLCFPGAQQAKRPTDPQRDGFKPADRWGQQLSAALCHPPCPQRSPLDGSAYFIWVFEHRMLFVVSNWALTILRTRGVRLSVVHRWFPVPTELVFQ